MVGRVPRNIEGHKYYIKITQVILANKRENSFQILLLSDIAIIFLLFKWVALVIVGCGYCNFSLSLFQSCMFYILFHFVTFQQSSGRTGATAGPSAERTERTSGLFSSQNLPMKMHFFFISVKCFKVN